MRSLNVLWITRSNLLIVIKASLEVRASTIFPKGHVCFGFVELTMLEMSASLLVIIGLSVSKEELCTKSGARLPQFICVELASLEIENIVYCPIPLVVLI